MSFDQRREYLFLYTVQDANPNGNPLEENHPRYDEDTQQAMASDVRIKRTIRDQWLRRGYNVFIDAAPKSLKTRFEEVKESTGLSTGREVLAQCLDTRLFGITFALGNESFAWTGPLQFKWARSLHAASFVFVQGTSAFATESRDETKAKQQRSFRNEYLVPFALIAVYGIANQYAADMTGATDADLQAMQEALWEGTDNLITRSKNEHKSRLLLEITYKEGYAGKIGALDQKLHFLSAAGEPFTREEEKNVRSLNEVKVGIAPLCAVLQEKAKEIESVKLYMDRELELLGMEELDKLGFVKKEMR